METQVRLDRSPPALSDVAAVTRTDDVLPRRGAVLGSGDHMIKRQLRRGKPPATVLTRIVVTGQDVPPVELDLLTRNLGKGQDADDARREKVPTNGSYPIAVSPVELALQGAELSPIIKIVGDVPSLFDAYDLGDRLSRTVSLEQKGKRTPNGDHTKGCVMRVKQQNIPIETGGWIR